PAPPPFPSTTLFRSVPSAALAPASPSPSHALRSPRRLTNSPHERQRPHSQNLVPRGSRLPAASPSIHAASRRRPRSHPSFTRHRSEEHTSELQSREN